MPETPLSTLPTPTPTPDPHSENVVTRLSKVLGFFRWAFMPMGLCALAAVGVHAAADAVDDRLLWAVDWLDTFFDGWLGQWSVTESLVHLVDLEQRTLIARVFALSWEISADVVIALPLLGYEEQEVEAAKKKFTLTPRLHGLSELIKRAGKKPTVAKLARPLATAAFVVAGTCAIARMVQGALYLSLRSGVMSDDLAGPLARLVAVSVVAVVLARFGWRAVVRSLQHADELSEAKARSRLGVVTAGLWGTVVVAPMALAAAVDASPLLSFFR